MYLVGDTHFYFTHRALHHPFLYTHVHKVYRHTPSLTHITSCGLSLTHIRFIHSLTTAITTITDRDSLTLILGIRSITSHTTLTPSADSACIGSSTSFTSRQHH